MRIIITESQNKLLWLRRRFESQHDFIKSLIIEGFDFTDVCDYTCKDCYRDFEMEIIGSSAITYIHSFEELFNMTDEEFKDLYRMSFDYMEENFSDMIRNKYMYLLEICEEL